MARKKVELKWIEKDSARKASLKKRREGLLKKVNELTVLCGIQGCAVIVTPGEDTPMHWPPTREGVEQVMNRFFSLPEIEQCKKMTTLESYLGEKIGKMEETMMKQQKKRAEMEMNQLMHQIFSHGRRMEDLSMMELDGLSWFMGEKEKEIKRRKEFLKQTTPGGISAEEEAAAEEEAGHIGGGSHWVGGKAPAVEDFMWDQWLMGTVNPNENIGNNGSGGNNNMGFPHWNIGSSSNNGGNDMGLPQPQGNGNDMGLAQGNFGGGNNMVVMPHCNIGSSSNGGNDMGLPQENFGGGNNMVMPHWNYGSSSNGGSDIAMPHWNYGGSSSNGGSDMAMPHWNFGSSSNGGNDMRLPLGNFGGGNSMVVPHWNFGSSSNGGNDMGPPMPQGNIGGSSSNGGGNIGGQSYQIGSSWPYNFST